MSRINLENLKEEIKKEEGYRLEVYTDTEGFPTGGYGHKIIDGEEIPTTKEGWEELFEKDFARACEGGMNICGDWDIKDEAKAIIIHMVYQMGEAGVRNFKRALSHLFNQEYSLCAAEMLNSRWANQTPNRAKRLSDHMANL
ncbi:MAG: glycoside hydrolase family protein [Bacteroidetes bacterium]|nr:glycoside hydrolase family protein [Bacteroidota bacterium]